MSRAADARDPLQRERDNAVLDAAIAGDRDRLRHALDRGGSVDAFDRYGEPALQWAARMEKPDTFLLLLQRGANLHDIGPLGNGVLHCLAPYPSMLTSLRIALARGAVVDARNDGEQTPLMFALRASNLQAASVLQTAGADLRAIDGDGGNTLFHLLNGQIGVRRGEDREGQLRWVARLLESGVDPERPGQCGDTATTLAARRGLVDVLQLIAGYSALAHSHDQHGLSALQAAAIAGATAAAQLLQQQGAELDILSAASLGDLPRVRALIDGDPALANARQGHGWQTWTPLAQAIAHGHRAVVLYLLTHGADPNGPDPHSSSLHNLLRNLPDIEVLRALISAGVQIDRGDGDNNTALNFAARYDQIGLAELLLQHGADPNSETERGYRPSGFATSDAMRDLLRRHGGR